MKHNREREEEDEKDEEEQMEQQEEAEQANKEERGKWLTTMMSLPLGILGSKHFYCFR